MIFENTVVSYGWFGRFIERLISITKTTRLRYSLTLLAYATRLRYSLTLLAYATRLRYSLTLLAYATRLRYSLTILAYATRLRYSLTLLASHKHLNSTAALYACWLAAVAGFMPAGWQLSQALCLLAGSCRRCICDWLEQAPLNQETRFYEPNQMVFTTKIKRWIWN